MSDWGRRVFAWFDAHGRHDLPWQHPRDPYRVWVSEVMLQQTTVAAVIPYFQRFVEQLPDVRALAAAPADTLMALWSGLGYYARARNLHAAAQIIVSEHGGRFPDDMDGLQALPGVGRSTAAAVLAQAFDRPAAILDGNVKRLLARHGGIAGWPGLSAVSRQLWQEAEARLPRERPADYAQALMDLGATICKRRRPACGECPVAADCRARREGRIDDIPGRRPAKPRPLRQHWYLILRNPAGELLLTRRPPSGIWGGLWALPEARDSVQEFAALAQDVRPAGDSIRHEFTHFSLELTPVTGRARPDLVRDGVELNWHTVESAAQLGLPQPIRRLIEIHCA